MASVLAAALGTWMGALGCTPSWDRHPGDPGVLCRAEPTAHTLNNNQMNEICILLMKERIRLGLQAARDILVFFPSLFRAWLLGMWKDGGENSSDSRDDTCHCPRSGPRH